MAGSNRDSKGSFQAEISQDVIDEALKSVERRAHPPESGDGDVPEGGRTLEMDIPEGMTLEVDVPPSVFGESESGSGAPSMAALTDTRQRLEAVQRELEEARAQLEFSQTKSRETMERLKESHERALRATADLENYKKRAQKEKEEIQKFGLERLLKDFLPVLDNLDRALEASQKSTDFEAFRTGVEMTRKLFDSAMGKQGVKGFSAVGQPFDPRLHEAMQQVESATVPPGHVVYEAVRGYMLNDRLMRPALVVVARAPEGARPEPVSSKTPGSAPTGGATSAQPGNTPSEGQ
ncbi:nucleotide exchange factor GrpE [Cystobacter ferrugineus]|uniref:Protein GrpE n=1 Tax=Cystobacter ferrugineus TaxID=83449 RepID=A0A1L9BJ61_9BACT|nr:nucleotide exchange factor GrpE [Cystobacter ferrugineus]OJH42300.1 nucleotide exchange factor GrpE [Cystobacter ferrugineus]